MFFLCLLMFSCRKNPKGEMMGNIVSYTKNGVSRMDTIHKYFGEDPLVMVIFTDGLYLSNCSLKYIVGGNHYTIGPSADNCLNDYLRCHCSGNKISVPWYSISDSAFVSLVDGVSPCHPVYWKYRRKNKSRDFDLEYTTPAGDVYKLEFR